MKSVQFLTMVVKDFKSFRGEHQLPLDLKGLWFVRGRNRDEKRLGANGVGKSSLWDALCWCLTGQTIEGLRGPDVKPWAGGKPAVSVLVQVDGKRKTISRGIGPNYLRIGSKDVGPEAVLKLIGMSYDVLTNTILLGQGRDLFFDMKPAQKMAMLTETKQLDRWDERAKQEAITASNLGRELAEVQGEVIGLENGVKTLRASLKGLQKQEAAWRTAQGKQAQEDAAFLKKHERQLETLHNEVSRADTQYDSAMTEVKACERQISNLGLDVANAKSTLATRRAARERTIERIGKLNDYVDELHSTKKCPTCGQKVKHGDLAEHEQEVLSERTKLMDSLPKLRLKPIKRQLATAEDNLQHAQSYLGSFHTKADSAMQTLKRKQGELAQLEAQVKVVKARAAENPYTVQLRDTQQRIRDMDKDLAGAKADIIVIEKDVVRAKFWAKGFKDVKLHVIEEFLQELEVTTAGMLEEVGLVGWEVRYRIERETKSGTVRPGLHVFVGSPRSKGLVRWESWSGGERQRLRLVGALALSSVLLNHAGVEPNLEVLDEPTQHLSDEGVHDLCDYLSERARNTGRSIYYADHQTVDSAKFTGTITVSKTPKGRSQLAYARSRA